MVGGDSQNALSPGRTGLRPKSGREQDLCRFYRGYSMLGTFRPGEPLTVEPVTLRQLGPGDVVVYRGVDLEDGSDGVPGEIVHRVVGTVPGGLVTRGDNNPWADTGLVTEDNLVGRVTHVERGGRIKPVRGGRRGLWQVRLFHLRRRLRWRGRQVAAHLGRRFYRWLRDSGFVRWLWRPTIIRVHVKTEAGLVVKYVHHQRTVARWWPETAKFECRKPYDLIISRPSNGPSEK